MRETTLYRPEQETDTPMTLADLLTTLETRGALTASRMKDCKTSLKYLAAALGTASPEQCPVDAACHDGTTWTVALETHFATLEAQGRTISAHHAAQHPQ